MRRFSMSRIKFDPEQAAIELLVTLKNKGETKRLLMVLDTGSTFCTIPWKVAEALKLGEGIYREKTEIFTACGIENVPLVRLESLSVDGEEHKGTEVVVHDLPQKSRVDGLLGLSFLRNFNLKIDFKNGWLEME